MKYYLSAIRRFLRRWFLTTRLPREYDISPSQSEQQATYEEWLKQQHKPNDVPLFHRRQAD